MKKNTAEILLYAFLALAIVFSLISFSLIVSISNRPSTMEEVARLQLVRIVDSSCPECFRIDATVQSLKKPDVNITSDRTIEFSSEEARQLIEKYSIEELPTVIVLGDVNSSLVTSLWNQNWQVEMENGTQTSAVYAAVAPPYRDLAENRIRGLVNITRITDTSCAQCSSLKPIINSFEQAGVVIKNDVNLEYNSPQGAKLISDFGIGRVPSIVVSGDILEYPAVAQIWSQLNATEKNGSYALHVLQAPYRDIALNRIVGLVDVVYLNDSSCTNCYNVLVHRDILRGSFGVSLVNETVVDVNTAPGKALVSKYNITLVPSFVMSPDAKYYVGLMQVWPSVGTNEANGWYAFRNVTVLGGIYKNLETGKTIVPAG